MQYLKCGPIRIPYEVKTEGTAKTFHICGIKIPFSTYLKDGKKYYKIFGLTFRFENQKKMFITQSYSNYLAKNNMDEKKIEETARNIFREKQGYELNLENPRTMNEKIFWLKLNYHDPLITKCCDKFAVKEYVNEVLGPGHVVPTIASWDRAEDIDFSILPDKYALKVNWSSGFNIIVHDHSVMDTDWMRKQVAEWMKPERNSYFHAFNWGYKNMKPVVYAEKYMEQLQGQLYDYKFFCCYGEPKFWFIATDRFEKEGKHGLTHDFFDMDFNKLEFDYGNRGHSELPLEKPRFYDEMIRSAKLLSKPFPFVRVDFYETDDTFYVGEMTFYPGGGILRFDPIEWDYRLGEYITIPEKRG